MVASFTSSRDDCSVGTGPETWGSTVEIGVALLAGGLAGGMRVGWRSSGSEAQINVSRRMTWGRLTFCGSWERVLHHPGMACMATRGRFVACKAARDVQCSGIGSSYAWSSRA